MEGETLAETFLRLYLKHDNIELPSLSGNVKKLMRTSDGEAKKYATFTEEEEEEGVHEYMISYFQPLHCSRPKPLLQLSLMY